MTRAKASRRSLFFLINAWKVTYIVRILSSSEEQCADKPRRRGHNVRCISGERVFHYWSSHKQTLGDPPSLRTVHRLCVGRNAKMRRNRENVELSQSQLYALTRTSAAQGWG